MGGRAMGGITVSKFPLNMLNYKQKAITFYIPHLKTPQISLPQPKEPI